MSIHPHSGNLSVDSDGNLRVRNLIWNTSTLAWENATGTLAGGIAAAISNFPATQAVTQSGTWTVQPGNTANTTAWKVDASSVAVPITDNSGSLTVDYATTGSGTATGALRVELPTNGTGVVGLNSGTNAIGKLAANSGVDIGDVDVTSISAGSNLIGDVGLQPRTTGGVSFYKTIDLDESEEEVKATAGQIYGLHVMNLTAALLYFKLYNATAANVTVGTTVPDITIPVPGDNNTDGAGFVLTVPQGVAFSTAITMAATTGIADNDSGAPAANAMAVTVFYK